MPASIVSITMEPTKAMNPSQALVLLFCAASAYSAAPAHSQQRPASLCPSSAAAIETSIRRTMEQGAPGMIVGVARDGEALFVRAFGLADLEHNVPVIRGTVFKLASITKQFTAAALVSLVEDGKVSLDDPLSRYVPELPQAGQVTLYQLLVQTSGIPDYAEDPAGLRMKSVARTPTQMIEWIAGLQPRFHFEPGTRWAYSNSNYVLLGLVIERVSGQSLEAFFAERLARPAGLTATTFDDPSDVVPDRAQGYRKVKGSAAYEHADWISPTIPGAAGGLRTTVDDLLGWSHALFSGRVLAPGTVTRMVSPGKLSDGRTTKSGMPEEWQRGLNSDYGMGVFVTDTNVGRRIWHAGDIDGFSTWLAHYPDVDVTIAVMQNSESADIDESALHDALFAQKAPDCTLSRPSKLAD
jgi:D-alanyl-D-alanine carboxypeptidase